MERVTQNVYAATDIRGCNPGYVVTSEGVVVIDTPQLPTRAVAMREEVLKKGPVKYLINTESHIDHIFGNYFFAGLCPVIAHEHIMQSFWRIPKGFPFEGDPYGLSLEIVKTDDPEGLGLMPARDDFVVNAPTIRFSGRMTLRVGEHEFELIHTPGHTKEQIAVYVPKEKVVFVGDTVFCECQTWFHGADPDAWLHALDFLNALDVEYIVPGHGPICDKSYLMKQSAFIREWMTAVAVAMAKGWSLQECVERISFLDRFPVDIGQESAGPMIQRINVERLFNVIKGTAEKFR
jgi:cyclase